MKKYNFVTRITRITMLILIQCYQQRIRLYSRVSSEKGKSFRKSLTFFCVIFFCIQFAAKKTIFFWGLAKFALICFSQKREIIHYEILNLWFSRNLFFGKFRENDFLEISHCFSIFFSINSFSRKMRNFAKKFVK